MSAFTRFLSRVARHLSPAARRAAERQSGRLGDLQRQRQAGDQSRYQDARTREQARIEEARQRDEENRRAKQGQEYVVTGWIPVRSSWIAALKYDGKHRYCWMRLLSGREYRYTGVPVFVFEQWLSAASKGQKWWSAISQGWSPAVRTK